MPVNGKQQEITFFMDTKILGKKCSAVTSSHCCFHSYCASVVYQTFHSTTLEQAIFWDYGEGMQQLLVKLTSLQFFFYEILFFLWTPRGKHQQKPLPFRKQTPQSYDAATAYHLLQVNVKKQINDFSYNMPCISHRTIRQGSQSNLFLPSSPSQISSKETLLAQIYWNFLQHKAKTRLHFEADWQQIPLQKIWGHKIMKFPKLQGFQKGRNAHLYFTGKDPELLQKSQRPIKGNAIPVKGCNLVLLCL